MELSDADIEAGQVMPPGKEIRMLQIIFIEKIINKDANKLHVKEEPHQLN